MMVSTNVPAEYMGVVAPQPHPYIPADHPFVRFFSGPIRVFP